MRNHYPLCLAVLSTLALNAFGQTAFTEHPELLPYATHSGNCMAVTDLNDDGRDDIAVLDNSKFLKVLYQNADGKFTGYDVGQLSNADQWGMAVADMNNDGHKDCFSGGDYDGVHYTPMAGPGVAGTGTAENASLFMQNTSIGDINNDGWLDVLGCHDNAAPVIWINDGSGNLNTNTYIDFTTNPVSDMSGNYGSVFADFDGDGDLDLFLVHCRQGVNDPNDPRRWNRLFVNDGNNNYTDQIDAYGLTDHHQSWAADFGDWDNDGDLDLVVINHDTYAEFFQNDGTGHYTAVDGGGLQIEGFLLQCHFEDFDNDGFLDILITGGSQYFLHGNGDGTFSPITNLFPAGGATMHGFAIGDLNNDGFMDVWANYGTGYTTPNSLMPDKLWLNNGNGNHWLNVRLHGVTSNRDGIGARVTLETALGTQVREVRSGESYGLTNTAMCHFGLGANTTVTSMTIHWPSGQVDTYSDITADQQLTAVEGACIAPAVAIANSSGAYDMCPGAAPITLTASGGSSYLWDSDEATADISVATPGYHTVTVDGDGNCPAFTSVFVVQTPGITPAITANGPTDLCWNQTVTLTSSPADSYLWNTGETTQSITPESSGDFFVTVDDACPDVPSDTLTVTQLPTPPAPVSSNVTILGPGNPVLTATGDSIVWYDEPEGGTLVGSGSPWTGPYLTEDASFWCAEATQPMLDTLHGGMANPGDDWHDENDATFYPIFDCWSPFQLRSVLVHATSAGPRLVALVSSPSEAIIDSATFVLPIGESRIVLDWNVAPGTYGLRMLGDDIGVTYNDVSGTYPYPLGDLGAIVSTTNGGSGATAYYEIFYDWVVGTTHWTCEGPRTQVDVHVSTEGISEAQSADRVKLWPVPAHALLNVDLSSMIGPVDLQITDITGRVVRSLRSNGNAVRSLDVSGLAPGGYQLRITSGNAAETHRFTVE